MKQKSPVLLLSIVVPAIIAVVLLQLLLSIKNYRETKTILLNDIKTTLSYSLEYYFAEEAEETFITVVDAEPNRSFETFMEAIQYDTVLNKPVDSITIIEAHKARKIPVNSYYIVKGKRAADSLMVAGNMGNKISFPFRSDSIDLNKINRFFSNALKANGIPIAYNLLFFIQEDQKQALANFQDIANTDTLVLQSLYFPDGGKMKVLLNTPAKSVLERAVAAILLSLLLTLIVILCLFFLLKVIWVQQRNEAIKNDFISNITHEFKTPIATASAALESLINFNQEKDHIKTERYLQTAREHLVKLDSLANKILDTAAMENQRLNLELKMEELSSLLQKLVIKYQGAYPTKKFRFLKGQSEVFSEIDRFYFESALGNIIDNAAKHGGEIIDIELIQKDKGLTILISDNGSGIDMVHVDKIFDKFYRIPQGNVHKVKGFGLGLYHAKHIMESHGATLDLRTNVPPVFKIYLPHAS